MPTHDYVCEACGDLHLDIRRKHAAPQPTCPDCGRVMKRLPSAPGLKFAGGGWAKDGYSKGKK